jgi:carboxymethylenebutenolidase
VAHPAGDGRATVKAPGMPRTDVTITTRDGACPASVFTPAGSSGPWPAVIFYMDGFGIRPAMWSMAARLADAGYLVLLPDLYYRSGAYEPMEPKVLLAQPSGRETLMRYVGSLDRDKKIADTEAFLDDLATRSDVKGGAVGATGYCLGGNCALNAIGAFPKRFASIASFHGGQLATDAPDSPHRFLGGVTGRVYVAGAIEDASFDDEQKERLEAALTVAGVHHLVETYAGARHGWAVPDIPVYDEAAAERHWTALFGLLHETL